MKFVVALAGVLLLGATNQQAGKIANSPREVCQQLLQAAKNNDSEAAMRLSKGTPKGDPQANGLNSLKDLNCSNQVIAGERAIVVAKSDQEKRLVPFVMDQGTWKFDLSTYQSFYRG